MIRSAEARNACEVLKVQPVYFGQIDGNTVFNRDQMVKMENLLQTLKPDLVFIHWPIDTHPAHQVTAELTFQG
ncbi:MAG TPA: PIG-L family deacetylase [Chitinophagaceae bacterium]|nr:PIG-L family deacetylase [Chitinophagaceae bacterium]